MEEVSSGALLKDDVRRDLDVWKEMVGPAEVSESEAADAEGAPPTAGSTGDAGTTDGQVAVVDGGGAALHSATEDMDAPAPADVVADELVVDPDPQGLVELGDAVQREKCVAAAAGRSVPSASDAMRTHRKGRSVAVAVAAKHAIQSASVVGTARQVPGDAGSTPLAELALSSSGSVDGGAVSGAQIDASVLPATEQTPATAAVWQGEEAVVRGTGTTRGASSSAGASVQVCSLERHVCGPTDAHRGCASCGFTCHADCTSELCAYVACPYCVSRSLVTHENSFLCLEAQRYNVGCHALREPRLLP